MKAKAESNVEVYSRIATHKHAARVMVVDDEQSFCELVEEILKSSQEFMLVATFQEPAEALEAVSRVRPDIVVIDVRMPAFSGIQCMEQIRAAHPDMRTLLVTGMLDTLREEEKAAAWRANGFLAKPFTPAQFLVALEAIACGETARSFEVEAFLFAQPAGHISNLPHPEFRWHADLSKRENEIARLLCHYRNEIDKELAGRLGMPITTFYSHLRSVYKKLNVHSRAEAIQKLTTRQPS